jgi:DNA-binding transcriptional LysR family regulator
LEDHFGTALLTKDEGGLVPTPFGHSVLEHIRRMDNEANAINRSSASLEQSLAGPVRISATEGLGTHWLPYVMQAFRASHPDILVDLSVDFRTFNLAQREADIALRWMGPGNQNSLIGRKVLEAGFGVFASESVAEKLVDRPVCKDDLAHYDSVVCRLSEGGFFWPKDDDGNHVPFGRVTFVSNNMMSHTNALIAGYGLGIMPLAYVEPEMGLVRFDMQDEERDAHYEDLWIVAHEDLTKSVRIRAVFDFLVDALRKDRAHFMGQGPSIFECGVPLYCGGGEDLSSPNHKHVLTTKELVDG